MPGRTTRVALLATLVAALAMTAAAVRADPSAAPATAVADNCLTQPNGPAPAGSHWYYRVERTSGRRCWHVRAQVGGNADRKVEQGERAVTRSTSAPAARPAVAPPPDPLAGSGDNGPSAAPPVLAPPNAQADWPTPPSQALTPPAAPSVAPPAVPAPAEPAPPPAIDSTPAPSAHDANEGATDATPAPPAPAVVQARPAAPRAAPPAVARPAASVIDPSHVPALLGTALVLAFIILASIAARLAGRFLRRRAHRRTVAEVAPNWDALFADTPAPDITGVLAAASGVRRRDRATGPEPRQRTRIAEPAREARHMPDDRPTPQMLENNVRELLHRLQRDMAKPPGGRQPAASAETEPDAPMAPMAPMTSPPSAPAAGDLEAALAVWSGKTAPTRQ